MTSIFQDDNYNVSIIEGKECLVTSTVKVSKNQTVEFYNKSIKKIGKNVLIPGFRKGKAPSNLITANNELAIRKEWNDLLVNEAFIVSTKLSSIRMLNNNSMRNIRLISCSLEEGAVVEFEFERYPVVPNVALSSLKLSPIIKETSIEQDTENQLKNLMFIKASWTSTEKPSEENDYVNLSLFISSSHEGVSRPLFEDKKFKLSSEDMATSFLNKIKGLEKGSSFEDQIDNEEIIKEIQGDTLIFQVNDVITPTMPELNDEFAISFGASSLEDLKAKIHIQMSNKAKELEFSSKLKAAEEALNEAVDFELPKSLITNKFEELKKEKLVGARLVEYLSNNEVEQKREAIESESLKEACKFFKTHFLVKHIFASNNLVITKEELQMVANQIYNETCMQIQTRLELTNDLIAQVTERAKERLIFVKALNEVIASAEKNVVDAPSTEEACIEA